MSISRRRTLKSAIERIAPEVGFQHPPRACIYCGCLASLALLMSLWLGLSAGAAPTIDVRSELRGSISPD